MNAPRITAASIRRAALALFVLSAAAEAQDTAAVRRAAMAVCGAGDLARPGVIFGAVDVSGDSTPRAGVAVSAKWSDSSRTARTDARGVFRFCGVPAGVDIVLSASVEGATGAPYQVRVPIAQPIVRADLSLDQIALDATFVGVVMIDSTRTPIVGAQITLSDAGRAAISDGQGAFRIVGIPPGDHRVSIRRIGYGALDTRMLFPAGETVTRNVFLSRAVLLDSVRTTAMRNVSLEFEENRRLGLGKFLTREDLETAGEATLGAVLSTVPGLQIMHGRGAAWIASSRSTQRTGVALRTGDAIDLRRGAMPACYSNVYLDNLLLYSGRAEEPLFDIASIHASDIENIEYYTNLMNMPMKYMSRNKEADLCGVIVIRTRR